MTCHISQGLKKFKATLLQEEHLHFIKKNILANPEEIFLEKFIFGIKREKVIWHILKNQPKIEKDIDDKQCVVIQQVIKPAEIAAYTYCTVHMNTNLLRTFFYKIKEGVWGVQWLDWVYSKNFINLLQNLI